MKIMILTGSMGSGGAQTHVFELARSLMRKGHSVSLVSSGGQYARALARLGVKCHCIDVNVSKPLSLLGCLIALHALILRERPDVIHAHTRPLGLMCRLLKSKLNDMHVAYVSTVHARFVTDSPLRRLPWCSGDCIAVSEDLKQYLLDLSRGALLPERVTVIPNGIDTDRFYPMPRDESDKAFRIVFMSRLDSDCSETARLLCLLAPRICKLISNAQIYVIGGGTEFDEINALAADANRKIGRLAVRALGKIDAPEFILSRCDVFVGVSRATLEAMSCGLPIILSGNEGFGGLIKTDGDLKKAARSNFCGRDQSATDKDKLMQSIEEIYSTSRRDRDHLGKKMRRFVIENNSVEEMARRTERVYREAVLRARSRTPHTLLCGYYGFDNMGDDALLSRSIELAAPHGVVAMTHLPHRAEYKFGIECIDRSSPISIARAIKQCRRLVFGGGSLLQSRTSLRSLCWYAGVLIYAHSQGKRVELWANGIDDLSRGLAQSIAARALACADRIGVRDERSAKTARSLLGKRDAEVSRVIRENDLALSCRPSSEARTSFILSRIGLCEHDRFALIFPKGYGGSELWRPNRRRNILHEFACLKRRAAALKKNGITPVFVATYPAQDEYITRRLCASCGGKMPSGLGMSDLTVLISRAVEVISMRYHPSVIARELGVPYYSIGSDPKLRYL